jgi:hypothetical protein
MDEVTPTGVTCGCWMDGCGLVTGPSGVTGLPAACQHDGGCPERQIGLVDPRCCRNRPEVWSPVFDRIAATAARERGDD